MTARTLWRSGLALVVLALLATTATAIWLLTRDFDVYKPALAARVKAETGRDLIIRGPIAPRLGLAPSLVIEGVSLGNASWGAPRPMLAAERLEAQLRLVPLLASFGRRLVVDRVLVEGAEIWLETDGKGGGNWRLPNAAASPTTAAPAAARDIVLPDLEIGRVELTRIGLSFLPAGGQARRIDLDTLTIADFGADDGGRIAARFRVDRLPIALDGKIGGKGALTTGPFGVDLAVDLGGAARLALAGAARLPPSGSGHDLAVTAEMPELSRLGALAELAGFPGLVLAPEIGPMRFTARLLGDRSGATSLRDIALTGGGSDLAGEIRLTQDGKLPRLAARFDARALDLARLLPATSRAVVPPPAIAPASPTRRVIPDTPLPYAALSAVDMDLALQVDRLRLPGADLEALQLRAQLREGVLALQPVAFAFEGGKVALTAKIDGRAGSVAQTIDLSGLEFGRLLESRRLTDWFQGGPIQLRTAVSGSGATLRAVAASLTGDTTLEIGAAAIGRTLQLLVGDWLASVAPPLAQMRIGTALTCAAYRISWREGVGTLRQGVIETPGLTIRNAGSIDLGSETLALRTLVGPLPIRTEGSFLAPRHAPDAGAAIEGLLGRGTPPATGPGCGAAPPAAPAAPAAPRPAIPGILQDLLRR